MKNAIPCVGLILSLLFFPTPSLGQSLEDIVTTSNIHGGFVVQVGCFNSELTFTLARKSNYQIQVLDIDPARISTLRRQLRDKKLYGKVTVDVFAGPTLPYVENLVNLIVIAKGSDVSVPMAEHYDKPARCCGTGRAIGCLWT